MPFSGRRPGTHRLYDDLGQPTFTHRAYTGSTRSEEQQEGQGPGPSETPASYVAGGCAHNKPPRVVAPSELARNEDTALACARSLGIDAGIGEPFRGVLPGRDSPRDLAHIVWDEGTGSFKYHDMRVVTRDGAQWHTLAGVRASQGYGYVVSPRSPEAALAWWPRLGYESGLVAPAEVDLGPLPESASSADWRVGDGFALMAGLKWAVGPRTPIMFTGGFGAAWCDLPATTVRASRRKLIRWGVVTPLTRERIGGWWTTTLWPEAAADDLGPANA